VIDSPWGPRHEEPLVVGQPQPLPVELAKRRVELNILKLDNLRLLRVEMQKWPAT
jgi:hypothetical protein